MTSPKGNMLAVVKARLKEETPLRSVSIAIAAAILFALNTSANAQLKALNDDAVRAARLAAARQACVTHQETALINDLVRNCENLARGPAFEGVQYSAWQRCSLAGLMGTIDSPKRLKWLRANQTEKNRMCLDAVEEAKNNRNNPNALYIYKPKDEPTGTRTNRQLKSDRVFDPTQRQLNSKLADLIADSRLGRVEKLSLIDKLVAEGADLNGVGAQHGRDPFEAVVSAGDVELLGRLLTKGMKINSSIPNKCNAYHAVQNPLEEPQRAVLRRLLRLGLDLRCLHEPPIHRITVGIALDSWDVNAAIEAAKLLIEYGADVNASYVNQTVIQSIEEEPVWKTKAVPLLAFLRSKGGR